MYLKSHLPNPSADHPVNGGCIYDDQKGFFKVGV